jgi:hypothetical protein
MSTWNAYCGDVALKALAVGLEREIVVMNEPTNHNEGAMAMLYSMNSALGYTMSASLLL